MKTVKIEKIFKTGPYNFYCSCDPNRSCKIDHSGTYVLASAAAERERVLVEALKEIIDYSDGQTRPDAEYMCDIASAALAAKEE